MDVLLGALLGLSAGFQHAFEPDHLAAVSTLVTEKRSPRSGLLYASLWGMGHASMLLLFGGALLVFRPVLSQRWDARFELCVGVVLIALGLRAVQSFRRTQDGTHSHGALTHSHAPSNADKSRGEKKLAVRSLGVGLLHGLAGSGALTALVIAKRWESAKGLLFMGLFGLGATLGMAVLGGIFGYTLFRVARSGGAFRFVSLAAGILSLAIGFVWIGKNI